MNKKILTPVVILIALLSGVFFLVLFSSVRCEPDDMIISLELREKGFWKAFTDRYTFYSFRPVYTLASFVTMGYSNNTAIYPFTIFIFYTAVYALFVFAIYKLLRELFSLKELSLKKKFLLISFSNILILCLYFLTTERIEIFGWVSASIIHLVPVVFVFLSAWLIVKQSKIADYVLLIITAAIIGGGAEHIAASVIISLAIIILWNRNNQTRTPQIKKVWFFTILLSLFLAICVLNPGVWLHYNEVHRPQDGFATQHTVNSFEAIKLFGKPHKLIGLIFLFIFWILFQNAFKTISATNIKPFYFILALCVTVLISSVLSIYGYHTLSVGRVWFGADVALFILLSSYLTKILPSFKISAVVSYIGAGIFILILILFDARHIPALVNFASKHDKIISSLQQKNKEETIVLDSFPKPDLTNQVALSDDPKNDVNLLFCRFYSIQAKISVKK